MFERAIAIATPVRHSMGVSSRLRTMSRRWGGGAGDLLRAQAMDELIERESAIDGRRRARAAK